MAVKKTRRKLFKVAKELNLSHQTIAEFLDKKGFEVSGLNTPITDEMYDEILKRFAQEKQKAEKLAKRKQERVKEETVADQTVETTAEAPETAVSEEVTAPQEETEQIKPAAVEETAQEELPAVESGAPQADVSDEDEEHLKKAGEKESERAVSEEAIEKEDEINTEAVGVETEELEADAVAEAEEEEEEEKPKVGDIIDHPVAKQYLERQREKEIKKKEKKKKGLKKIREEALDEEGTDESRTRRSAKSGEEIIPRRILAQEKEEMESEETAEVMPEDTDVRSKKKKDKKKKTREEDLTEKERRRRKAFEMIRKEGRKPRTAVPDMEDEEGVVVPKDDKRKRSRRKKEVDQQEVQDTLKKTLASMQDTGAAKKRRKKVKETAEETEEAENVISASEFITVQDLANLMDVPVADVIKKCLELGQMVTINQRLDMDMIRLLAEDFGFKVQEEEEFASDYLEDVLEEEDKPEDYVPRHPVVTVMGHVDHGKTSVLDYIRKANVVAGESGGITQHIGAYVVELDDKRKITFLDTPGHEAFTAMRSRGAQVTDIVVLVVAADDRVMPQTEEAIDHARAAGVPIVIAINKVDKPHADPQAIRKQLADRNILVEDWGGKYQVVEVSAKTGQGIPDLLEKILLEAELMELKANPKKRASGVVIESLLDKGKGSVATVLVQQGILRVGDDYIAGQYYGRVRALLNERNQRVEEAGPAFPVQVLGTDGVPEAGDKIIVMRDEKTAREIAQRRQQLKREQDFRQIKFLTLDEISRQIAEGQVKELNILVKADVDGSAQALTDSLLKISNSDVAVKVVRRAVGPITESDVMLAAASQAIIIGFHVRPTLKAKDLAEQEKVDIRLYKVIYDAIDDVKKALEGLLEPEEREQILGLTEVREVFKISRMGTVAGCYVLNGKINRNARIRLIRNDVEIYEGRLSSLKRFKDDVREVVSGYECGLMIENYNDIKVGDQIEAFEVVQEKRYLES